MQKPRSRRDIQEQGTERTGSVSRKGESACCEPCFLHKEHLLHFVGFFLNLFIVCLCPLHWVSNLDIHCNHPENFKK